MRSFTDQFRLTEISFGLLIDPSLSDSIEVIFMNVRSFLLDETAILHVDGGGTPPRNTSVAIVAVRNCADPLILVVIDGVDWMLAIVGDLLHDVWLVVVVGFARDIRRFTAVATLLRLLLRI